jgi:hypothetical protein
LREQRFSGPIPAVVQWIARRPRLLRWIGANRRMERLPRKFAAHLNWHLNTELPARFDRGGLARLLSEGGRLDAPAFLLRSLEQVQGAPADLHWRQLCTRLTVVPILGSHYHLFERQHAPLLLLAMAHMVRLGLAAAGLPSGPGSPPAAPREADPTAYGDSETPVRPRGGVDGVVERAHDGEDRWAHVGLASPGRDA